MITAKFLESNLDVWRSKERVTLGGHIFSDPCSQIGVSIDEVPFKLIDLCVHDEYTCFQSVKTLGNIVVVGFGESVHFIDIISDSSKSIRLDGYFSELYTPEDFGLNDTQFKILVASCEYLHHFDSAGTELWKSHQLGIDGVIVHDVIPSLIKVAGEWDPPGGWEEVTLSLSSGQSV